MDLQKELQKIDSRFFVVTDDKRSEITIMLDDQFDEYNSYPKCWFIWSDAYGFELDRILDSTLTLEQYRELVEAISHYKRKDYYDPMTPATPFSFSPTQSAIEGKFNRSSYYDVKDYTEIMKLALYPEMKLIRFKNIPKSYHHALLSTDLSRAKGKIKFLFDLRREIKFAYPVAFTTARDPFERRSISEHRIQMFKDFGLLDKYDPEVWENIDDQPLDETTDREKDSSRTYCQVCGRKMTLSNVFKEPSGRRISWKFVCHYCDTVTQFYTGDSFEEE